MAEQAFVAPNHADRSPSWISEDITLYSQTATTKTRTPTSRAIILSPVQGTEDINDDDISDQAPNGEFSESALQGDVAGHQLAARTLKAISTIAWAETTSVDEGVRRDHILRYNMEIIHPLATRGSWNLQYSTFT